MAPQSSQLLPHQRGLAWAGLIALVVTFALPISLGGSAASAATGQCPPGFIPGPSNSNEVWTDDNVAVYAGSDFEADGAAAESEGLMVVMGNATFDKDGGGHFNIGTVGVGSGVTPTPGTVMLAVGGNLTVGLDTVLDVGAGAYDDTGILAGGATQVGGSESPTFPAPQYVLNNGSLNVGMGAAAVATWATFGADLTANATAWAGLAPTGTAVASGSRVDFTGDGASNPQVFSIAATDLAGVTEFYYTNIPDASDTAVIINVTGAGPVSLSSSYVGNDGVRADDLGSTVFGQVAQRTMWSFAEATDVAFTGSGQFLGSVAVPSGNVDMTASMNGRVYTGGSIRMHGTGNEVHNYPWNAVPYACVPVPSEPTGSVQITKVLDPDAPVADDRVFYGWLRCAHPTLHGIYYHEGSIQAGTTVTITGLPVGAECFIFENPDFTGPDQPPLPPGFLWAQPVWTVDGTVTEQPSFTIVAADEPVQVEISVTNTALGRISVTKVTDGPEGAYVGEGAFTIGYTCDAAAYDDAGAPLGDASGSGTLHVEAGETVLSPWYPVGTSCRISESLPVEHDQDFSPPGGFTWTETSVSPETAIVGQEDTSPITVTVTNTFAMVSGSFTLTKTVELNGATFAGEYTLSYSCTPLGPHGSVTLEAGETSAPIAAPVGSECVVTENDVPEPPAGWTFAEPVITGSPLTITSDSAQSPAVVTVANTLIGVTPTSPDPTPPTSTASPGSTDPGGTPTGSLAWTGASPWPSTALGLVLLVGGMAASSAAHRGMFRRHQR